MSKKESNKIDIQCQVCGQVTYRHQYTLPAGWASIDGLWHCDECERDGARWDWNGTEDGYHETDAPIS